MKIPDDDDDDDTFRHAVRNLVSGLLISNIFWLIRGSIN